MPWSGPVRDCLLFLDSKDCSLIFFLYVIKSNGPLSPAGIVFCPAYSLRGDYPEAARAANVETRSPITCIGPKGLDRIGPRPGIDGAAGRRMNNGSGDLSRGNPKFGARKLF